MAYSSASRVRAAAPRRCSLIFSAHPGMRRSRRVVEIERGLFTLALRDAGQAQRLFYT